MRLRALLLADWLGRGPPVPKNGEASQGTGGGTHFSHRPKKLNFGEVREISDKNAIFQEETSRLREIFRKVEPEKYDLVDGLIQDAAFLKAENFELRRRMHETGMVEYHPTNRRLQRTSEAAKQYLKNVNSYAVIIKTLNGVLMKSAIEEDDEFEKFLREQREE